MTMRLSLSTLIPLPRWINLRSSRSRQQLFLTSCAGWIILTEDHGRGDADGAVEIKDFRVQSPLNVMFGAAQTERPR